MKTEKIRTDKIWEFRLVINDVKKLEELNEFWGKHKNGFDSKNGMLNYLIDQGLELEEMYENDMDLYRETRALSEKLTDINKMQDATFDWVHKGTKENYFIHNENQVLLQRIYHVLMRLAQSNGITVDLYDQGIFDGMPDGFDEKQKEIQADADEIFGK